MANTFPHGSTLGPLFAPAYHRPWLRYIEATPGAEAGTAAPPATGLAPAPETDWKAEARKWETRAKENNARATANDDAAKRLAEIEEAQKTEVERMAESLATSQAQVAWLAARALRAEVAASKGLGADVAEFLTADTQEALEAQADKLIALRGVAAPEPTPQSAKYIIPDEGGLPAIGKDDSVSAGMGTLRAAYAQAAEQKG